MKIRSLVTHAVAIVVAIILPLSAHAQTEIVLWHAMDDQLGEVVNEISDKFNQSQNDYKLIAVYKGNYKETLAAAVTAVSTGEQPNIVQVFDAGVASIIDANEAIVPVADLFVRSGVAFDAQDYIAGIRVFYAGSDGKMIGMPFNSVTPILYYHKGAMTKAGVQPPKTWEEFEQIAPKLKEAGFVALTQSDLPWVFAENFMSRHNQQFASNNNGFDGNKGTKLMINNVALKSHFTRLKQWYEKGLFGYYGADSANNQKSFLEGKAAMWIGPSTSFLMLRKAVKFEFSAAFLPYWEDMEDAGTNTFAGGAALFAMSGKPETENKGTAEIFKFLSSPEIQYLWHKETGYAPVTRSGYELATKEGHYQRWPVAEIGVRQLMLPGGEWTRGFRLRSYIQIHKLMTREFSKIFAEETSVDEAFKTIEKEGNTLLEQVSR